MNYYNEEKVIILYVERGSQFAECFFLGLSPCCAQFCCGCQVCGQIFEKTVRKFHSIFFQIWNKNFVYNSTKKFIADFSVSSPKIIKIIKNYIGNLMRLRAQLSPDFEALHPKPVIKDT